MLNISFLTCTKVALLDLIVCIVVNGEKFQSPTMTLTLIRQCPLSNLYEIFSYTTMCFSFMFLHQLLLSYRAKTHTHKHTHTQTLISTLWLRFAKRNYNNLFSDSKFDGQRPLPDVSKETGRMEYWKPRTFRILFKCMCSLLIYNFT